VFRQLVNKTFANAERDWNHKRAFHCCKFNQNTAKWKTKKEHASKILFQHKFSGDGRHSQSLHCTILISNKLLYFPEQNALFSMAKDNTTHAEQ
jgi:hypothetical protein